MNLCIGIAAVLVVLTASLYLSDIYQMCSQNKISNLCDLYEQNIITGTLCQDLCQNKEVVLQRCLSSNPDKAVFEATWKNKKIILKMCASSLETDINSFGHLQSYEDHKNAISASVNMLFGDQCKDCSTLTKRLLAMADVDKDGKLSPKETFTMIMLLQTPGPSTLLVLNGTNPHSLNVLGYCGHLYAVEKLPVNAGSLFVREWQLSDFVLLPDAFYPLEKFIKLIIDIFYQWFSMNFEKASKMFEEWIYDFQHFVYKKMFQTRVPSLEERFHFSFSLLDSLFTLADNQYGMIQMCDSHLGNFCLSETSEVKLVDYDMVYPQHHLVNNLAKLQCTKDEDCSVGHYPQCTSSCNVSTGFCTSKLQKQNLYHFCFFSLPLVFRNMYKDFDIKNSKQLICLEKAIRRLAIFCLDMSENAEDLKTNIEFVKQRLLEISLGKFHCK